MQNIHVKFTGKFKIDGESAVDGYKDQIGANTLSYGVRQPKSATASTAGGHTAERCEHEDMVFTKYVDKASPKLMEASSAGHAFDEIEISCDRNNGDKSVKYLSIKLKNAIVSSVTTTLDGEGVPVETFTLTYAARQDVYAQVDTVGKILGNTTGTWSLAKNTNQYTV